MREIIGYLRTTHIELSRQELRLLRHTESHRMLFCGGDRGHFISCQTAILNTYIHPTPRRSHQWYRTTSQNGKLVCRFVQGLLLVLPQLPDWVGNPDLECRLRWETFTSTEEALPWVVPAVAAIASPLRPTNNWTVGVLNNPKKLLGGWISQGM